MMRESNKTGRGPLPGAEGEEKPVDDAGVQRKVIWKGRSRKKYSEEKPIDEHDVVPDPEGARLHGETKAA